MNNNNENNGYVSVICVNRSWLDGSISNEADINIYIKNKPIKKKMTYDFVFVEVYQTERQIK